MEWTDERWHTMQGGYRIPFDPRPLLLALKAEPTSDQLWDQLIGELYHQGDIGEASYAAVVELARLFPSETNLPWQPVALVIWIDLARTSGTNPPMPTALQTDYSAAIEALALRCLRDLAQTTTPDQGRVMLSLIALWKGQRVYAKALGEYSEDEVAVLFPG